MEYLHTDEARYELLNIARQKEELASDRAERIENIATIASNAWQTWSGEQAIRTEELLSNKHFELDPNYTKKGFFGRKFTPSGGRVRLKEENIGPSKEVIGDIQERLGSADDYGSSSIDIRDIVSDISESKIDQHNILKAMEGPETIGEQAKGFGKNFLDKPIAGEGFTWGQGLGTAWNLYNFADAAKRKDTDAMASTVLGAGLSYINPALGLGYSLLDWMRRK